MLLNALLDSSSWSVSIHRSKMLSEAPFQFDGDSGLKLVHGHGPKLKCYPSQIAARVSGEKKSATGV